MSAHYGTALRRARKGKGVSLRALASHLGMADSHLAQVERGEKGPLSEEKTRQAAALCGEVPSLLLHYAEMDRARALWPHLDDEALWQVARIVREGRP